MTDDNTQASGEKAQRAKDLEGVDQQLKTTEALREFSDATTQMAPLAFGGLMPGIPALPPVLPGYANRTNFESHDLNAMIDLVESAKPEELENAGQALWRARDALKSAAAELDAHIKGVSWTGDGGTSFRAFGTGLVAHARQLSGFADTAAKQITVAGTGLASVYKAMPPRDSRFDKRKPEDVPMVSRVEGNATYDMAVKTEKNRQEAINQLNRLSSFYAVSQETLAAQEAPRFDKKLQANVPPPTGGGGGTDGGAGGGAARGAAGGGAGGLGAARAVAPADTSGPGAAVGRADGLDGAVPAGGDIARPGAVVGGVSPARGADQSMELARVATPPAPAPTTSVAPPVAPPAPGPALGTAPPPVAPGYMPPVQGGTARTPGMPPMGRAGTSGQPPVGRGGTSGQPPMGRAGTSGQPPMGRAGTSGQPPVGRGGTSGQPPMGRSGTSGQPPMGRGGTSGQPPMGRAGTSGQPPMGRAGTSGQPPMGRAGGRTDGIMGGNPQRTAPGSSGSRIPRGTVVGTEPGTSGRGSTGRIPTGGAVGANPVSGTPARPAGRPTSSTNGVVGTPRDGTVPSGRPGTGGFTQGGAGLVRGPAGQRNANEREERDGSQRPDYLTEDEETWTAGRRSAVPPVID